jgi:membrane protein YdbS with pleckstrin-like domain
MNPEIFENHSIDIQALPNAEDANYQSLEKSYLRILIIFQCIVFAILFGVYFVLKGLDLFPPIDVPYHWIPIVLLFFFILSLTLGYMGFFKKAYALRQRDILYKSGLIVRNQVAIPFNRIQHCEVQQGAIDRAFKIAKLKIYTAGGSSSDLSIPGLNIQTAERMKEFVLHKIIVSDEEE